jgi:ketosteroid isomerase-like protein
MADARRLSPSRLCIAVDAAGAPPAAARGPRALPGLIGLALRSFLIVALFATLATGCQTPGNTSSGTQAEVAALLEQQVREWNAGNLAGFMETYAKSEGIRFASGGDFSLGWQTVFDRYRKKYGDRVAMGNLAFTELDITLLGPDAALVFGRWRLKRDEDEPAGLFTLVFRKMPEGWRIVHDHTSAAEKK